MGQDAHPKNAGSFLKKQWLKPFETDPAHPKNAGSFLKKQYVVKYIIIKIIRLNKLNTKTGKTPTLCDKTPPPGILPHHSDKS